MKKHPALFLTVAMALTLSACSSSEPESHLPAPTPSSASSTSAPATASATTTSSAPTSATPSAAPSVSPESDCGTDSLEAELDRAISDLGNYPHSKKVNWNRAATDTSTFDACKDLSVVTLIAQKTDDNYPDLTVNRVLLFHQGSYVESATEHNDLLLPQSIEQVSDNSVNVTFRGPNDDTYLSTYRWNDDTHKITRTGELTPPWGVVGYATPTPSKKSTQSQGKGHEIPELPNQTGSGKAASIEVTSGNIGCSFYPDGTGGCGVKSYIAERKDRDAIGFAKWYFDLGNSSTEPQSKSDAPDWDVHSITAEYGNSYYYGDFQCESEETGLTCWNTTTGQGVFMSREGYHTVQK